MKQGNECDLPLAVLRAMKKLGADMRIARLKRGLTIEAMADSLDVHRTTYSKLENGDPMVSFGAYAAALFVLGFGTPIDELADPRRDETGLLLDLDRLPKRARATAARRTPFMPVRLRPRPVGAANQAVLKIGVLGVMSGPCAKWGLVNKYCALTTAEMHNERGGVEIDGERFRIEIVAIDDKLNPALARAGVEHLTEREGVRYIIGPNVEQTIESAIAIAERQNAMLVPYSYTRSMYARPRENAVLGEIPGFHAAPAIYRHLRDYGGAKRLSVLAPNTREGLRQRDEAAVAAERLGLRLVNCDGTYSAGADDLSAEVAQAVRGDPDVIVLTNLAPEDAPVILKTARRLGYRGHFATEAAQDINILNRRAGSAADGFVVLGGASTHAMRSPYMEVFARRYTAVAGEWNDEAGTKAYALEIILATLQKAGKRAIDNVNRFKESIPEFAVRNPFVKDRSPLRYVGANYFQYKRQIGVPMVVNTVKRGQFVPLFVENVN